MKLEIMAIPLTQGLYALVDGEDYEELNRYKWCASKTSQNYYASRRIKQNNKITSQLMHRQILNNPKGMEIDHRNRCGLDNRKNNLRICSCSENHQNTTGKTNKTSIYKGVCWNKRHKQWYAQITHNQKTYYLGHFDNEVRVALAYDKKAKELQGEFICPNF